MFENMNANQMGLLQTGLAILSNAYGPNARNAIGLGGMQGLQAMQQAKMAEQDDAYRKAQMKALEARSRQAEREMQVQESIAGLFGLGAPQQPTLLAQGAVTSDAGPTLLGGGAPPQAGGLAALDLNQVAAIKAMGGPDLLEPWKLAKEGIKQDAGATYIDPMSGQTRVIPRFGEGVTMQNGQAMALPGYAQAQAEIEGARAGATTAAQEAARFPYDVGRLEEQARRDPMQVVDPETGNTVYQPRSAVLNGGQGAGNVSQINPAVVEARQNLPKAESQAQILLNTIDMAVNHPGLEDSIGWGSVIPALPGSDKANFAALADQIQGQVFLQGFESMRGAGTITEVEGLKAEQSIARLNRAQSPEAYREALNELKGIVETGLKRAYEKAGLERPGAQSTQAAPQADTNDFSSLWGG